MRKVLIHVHCFADVYKRGKIKQKCLFILMIVSDININGLTIGCHSHFFVIGG